MKKDLRIAIAQIDPKVGDLKGNKEMILEAREKGAEQGAELVVFPEMVLTGYPPEDLLSKPDFIAATAETAQQIKQATAGKGPGVLVGAPVQHHFNGKKALYNAAYLFDDATTLARIFKQDLPNYGVFDEKRYFKPGSIQPPAKFRGHKLGVMICEDTWSPRVSENLARQGAELLISINGSPYEMNKDPVRLHKVLQRRTRETGLAIMYACLVGGQDQLVFDGSSMVVNSSGKLSYHGPHCQTALDVLTFGQSSPSGLLADFRKNTLDMTSERKLYDRPDALGELYEVLVLGIRDYFHKNGFENAVIGLSGGMDSALVLALAVDALGPDKVLAFRLPSAITGSSSMTDAADIAHRLGCRLADIPIADAVGALQTGLESVFGSISNDGTTTLENVQARIRGALLMGATNKLKKTLLLSTGNKSEVAIGYCTLYGDMSGGYNPLKDVFKTLVYALAQWRNANHPTGGLGASGVVIPPNIIAKPPSAELSVGQTDAKGIGADYAQIDPILEMAVDHFCSVQQILAKGHDPALVKHILSLVDVNEFKRQQACPGVKVTHTLFGRDWRMPITNGFHMSKLLHS